MADKVKKKKVKSKDEKVEEVAAPAAAAAAPPPPEPEPAPAPPTAPSSTKSSRHSSKRKAVKRSGSNVFSMFSTQQVAEFKEGFAMMDKDGDGILGKEDLRATWDMVGKLITDKELDDQLEEATGPVNFTQLLSLFASRMSGGGADDDATVRAAFMTFDENGKIDSQKLKYGLMSFGDHFTPKEAADALDSMDVDKNGMIDTEDVIHMIVSGVDD